jgi:Tfp pilus assembly protein FimT
VRPGAAGRRGIALVELVVTVAIGSTLLALAFGGQSMLLERRLTGAARTLLTDIRMLEQRARAERTCYRVVFDRPADTYTMARYTGVVRSAPEGGGSQCHETGGVWTGPVMRGDPADAVSRRLPRGVDLVATTFSTDTLVIGPLGNPNGGTVTLRSAAGAVRRVTVEPFGRARVAP